MPRYDYRCTECDDRFEVVRAIGDQSLVTCPVCGTAATRVFTPVGVVFKGTGFHNTDYRARSSESPKNEPAPAPACGGGSDAGCASCPSKAAD